MSTKEWLEWRAEGVGSSDAIVIMGEAPRHWEINTWHKLWNQKIHKTESEKTGAMKRGTFYEDDAIKWFEKETGEVFLTQTRPEHPEFKWMRATLDGISSAGS